MNKKLHVLFLCGWYPSRVLPTNGDFIQRHAEAVSLKQKVSVLHIITDPNLKTNIEIDEFDSSGISTYIGYVKKTWNPFFKFFLFWKTFFKILKKIPEFNIVHLNITYPFGLFALYLNKIKKIPYLITEHWTDYYYPLNKTIKRIAKFSSKKIIKNAYLVCPVTEDLSREMIKFGLTGNYGDVPNVVNTKLFNRKKNKGAVFRMIHISSMNDDQKNISGILETIQKLQATISEFQITFIGNDPSKYTSTINRLNLNKTNLHFVKHISQSELSKYLANSDLFILFSNFENLPCVILESFASGTPVISTNIGGISQYFPENFGVLIEKQNKDELYREILKYYHQEYPLPTLEEMNSYVEHNFGQQNICDRFSEIYAKALNLN